MLVGKEKSQQNKGDNMIKTYEDLKKKRADYFDAEKEAREVSGQEGAMSDNSRKTHKRMIRLQNQLTKKLSDDIRDELINNNINISRLIDTRYTDIDNLLTTKTKGETK